jgi:hypothetical protein
MRATREELIEALRGRLTDHQGMLLRMQLDHIRYLDQQIEALDTEVAKRLAFSKHSSGTWIRSRE